MGCDYYIVTEIVIEYINAKNIRSKITTNGEFKRGYLSDIGVNIQEIIDSQTYSHVLYNKGKWIKENNNYMRMIENACTDLKTLVKVTFQSRAWECT